MADTLDPSRPPSKRREECARTWSMHADEVVPLLCWYHLVCLTRSRIGRSIPVIGEAMNDSLISTRETMSKPPYVEEYNAIVAVLNKYNDGCKQAKSSIMKP